MTSGVYLFPCSSSVCCSRKCDELSCCRMLAERVDKIAGDGFFETCLTSILIAGATELIFRDESATIAIMVGGASVYAFGHQFLQGEHFSIGKFLKNTLGASLFDYFLIKSIYLIPPAESFFFIC